MASYAAASLAAVVIAAAGFVVGARTAPSSEIDTSIGRVAFAVSPSSHGDVTALVPVADYGLRADAFDAPFELKAELRSLERSTLEDAANGDLPTLESTESDLRDGARSAVLTTFGWGVGGALIALGIATAIGRTLHPRWLLMAVGGGLTVLLTGASLVAARTSFDAKAFERPTYFANGDELARVLAIAEDERVGSPYGSTFSSILRSITTVLAGGPAPTSPSRDIYLGSDLHANAFVVKPLSEYIADDPLVLAGDFGQRGGESEAEAISPRVAALGSQVIATSGNHDSSRLMEKLTSSGVEVLGDGQAQTPAVTEVDGLTIAGFPDPLEYQGSGDPANRPVTFDDFDDPGTAFDDAVENTAAKLEALTPDPAVAVIHQSAVASAVADRIREADPERELTILTGHDHMQRVSRHGSIIVVDGGTIGAGGAFDAGRAAIGFAELHFETNSPSLRSVDLISVEPFSGEAQASRVVISNLCPDASRCDYEPPSSEGSILGDSPENDGEG